MIGSLSLILIIMLKLEIGNNTRIEGATYIPPLTVIGNNVLIGPGATFTNDPYPMSKNDMSYSRGWSNNCFPSSNKTRCHHRKECCCGYMDAVVTKDVLVETVVIRNPAISIYFPEKYNKKKINLRTSC